MKPSPEERASAVLAEHVENKSGRTLDAIIAQAIRDAIAADRQARAAWHDQQAAEIRRLHSGHEMARWHEAAAKAICERLLDD